MIMPLSHSYQLPDLLGIISCLELRTNRFCRFATDTSEKWILEETDCISPAELSYLHSTKLGLLAALCFPTCDAPQLRLLTDLLTMLFYSNIRPFSFPGHSDASIQAVWPATERNDEGVNHPESGLDILENDVLFKQFSTYIHLDHPRSNADPLTEVLLIRESAALYLLPLTPGNLVSPIPCNSFK
jgi:hypothetical protein